MATITKKNLLSQPSASGFGGTQYGNRSTLLYPFETNASGVYVNSDDATDVGVGDVVRIGVLPAGMELHDCLAIISDIFRATSTAKLGFAYVDGSDDANVPQDDDYFFAALALDALGRTRANNTAVRPVKLPKDAYLILTNQVVAQNVAGQADFLIEGILYNTP